MDISRDTLARGLIMLSGALLADQLGYWQSWQTKEMLSLKHHEGIALAAGLAGILLKEREEYLK